MFRQTSTYGALAHFFQRLPRTVFAIVGFVAHFFVSAYSRFKSLPGFQIFENLGDGFAAFYADFFVFSIVFVLDLVSVVTVCFTGAFQGYSSGLVGLQGFYPCGFGNDNNCYAFLGRLVLAGFFCFCCDDGFSHAYTGNCAAGFIYLCYFWIGRRKCNGGFRSGNFLGQRRTDLFFQLAVFGIVFGFLNLRRFWLRRWRLCRLRRDCGCFIFTGRRSCRGRLVLAWSRGCIPARRYRRTRNRR